MTMLRHLVHVATALAAGASVVKASMVSPPLTNAADVMTLYPHVPLLLWSPRPLLNGREAYVSAELDEADVVATLESVLRQDLDKDVHHVLNPDATARQDTETPLCVLFLHADLRSAQLGDLAPSAATPSFVESQITHAAASSVVLPHTTRTAPLHTRYASRPPTTVPIEDLEGWTQSVEGQTRLRDHRSELVVIEISKDFALPQVDALIKAATKALAAATNDRVVFALTGDAADATTVAAGSKRRLALSAATATTTGPSPDDAGIAAVSCEAGYQLGIRNGVAFCFTHFVYMTPEVLTAVLLGLFFVATAYIGISALDGIQTPLHYPLQGPPRGKEF